jgi:hypothetical protein
MRTVLLSISVALTVVSTVSEASAHVDVVSRSDSRTVLRFSFDDLRTQRFSTPFGEVLFFDLHAAGNLAKPGLPDFPVVGVNVAVPDDAISSVRIIGSDSVVYDDVLPAPYREEKETREGAAFGRWYADKSVYLSDDRYPESPVVEGPVVVRRGLSSVDVSVCPVATVPTAHRTIVYTSLLVELNHRGSVGVGTRIKPVRNADFFRGTIGLPRIAVESTGQVTPTTYLVIHPPLLSGNDPLPTMQSFFDWKRRQGYEVVVRSTSVTGSSDASIKNYIAAYYDTCAGGLEAVLLVGDEDQGVPTHIYFYEDPNPADHWFVCVDGSDYIADLLVGRFPADNISELSTMVAKTVGYDTNADPAGGWYGEALVLGVEGYDPRPNAILTSAVATKKWLQGHMEQFGYTYVDSIFQYTELGIYPPPSQITASINAGKSAINYRGYAWYDGWVGPDYFIYNAQSLANGWKLPVITSIVCGTGNFGSDQCFGEFLFAKGTPTIPSGCVAFIGCTFINLSTRFNNALDAGLWWSVLYEDIRSIGAALDRGRAAVYSGFPLHRSPGQQVELYHMTYAILGDPTLRLRTRTPDILALSLSDSLPVGSIALPITVLRGGAPEEGAIVSVIEGDQLLSVGTTDAIGQIELSVDASTAGQILHVTATADDAVPTSDTVHVYEAAAFAAFDAYSVDDDNFGTSSGNGDGVPNPGETLELPVTLRNYGTGSLTGVTAVLSSDDPAAVVLDSVESFSDIPPSGTSTSQDDFDVQLDPVIDHGRVVRLTLSVSAAEGGPWTGELAVQVVGPRPSITSVTVVDGGNGQLEPGENAQLVLELTNYGQVGLSGLTGVLSSGFTGVVAVDPDASWPSIPSGSSADNSADPFSVTASSNILPGRTVTMAVLLYATGGYQAWLPFMLEIGQVSVSDPLGPDTYGYYAYDDGDIGYSAAPVYDWIELDPTYGGSGATQLILGDDDRTAVALPFTARVYGVDYDSLTVCTNGWAAFGDRPYTFFRNWPMPGALCAPAMVSVFWDDLTTQYGGKVFVRHDGPEARFVVEWSRVRHTADGLTDLKTLELVVLDPNVHTTPTGDALLLLQYHAIANNDASGNYATVGLCDETQMIGINYTYANQYPTAAAQLASGRAILFTTEPPDTFEIISTPAVDTVRVDTVVLEQPRPNPFNPTTTLSYVLPEGGPVRLEVTNLLGQRVVLLTDGYRPPGRHTVTFDASELASGVYLARLVAGGSVHTAKLLLIR